MATPTKKKKRPVKKSAGSKRKNELNVTEFHIEWVPINSIKLWEDNPRVNDDAAEDLAEIIRDHGIKSPIVCWDKNRVIYKGNTTYKACKILGMKTVPVVFHHFKSEAAANAYGIADNKASEMAEWDEEVLLNMMNQDEFKSEGLNTGFSDREIELLDFWPASEEKEKKAKDEGKELRFKIIVDVSNEEYQEAKKKIARAISKIPGAEIR